MCILVSTFMIKSYFYQKSWFEQDSRFETGQAHSSEAL
jgi:hypothetical protein